ncbi:MAG: 16S rRNA (cytosine(1402)-N(4))-methyltransferase RsmH [Acidimicrobiales bacterium]
MSQAFEHSPVMLDEVVAVLGPSLPGVLVDATVGGGGHSAAILAANPGLRLVGLDRDPLAVDAARARFPDATIIHARFDAIASVADRPVTAVLFDLGVSSPQLDQADRGFSYRRSGPLDMRMDPSQGLTANDVVNTYAVQALAEIFRANGEGRFAHRIASSIVAARPILDTVSLASVIRDAIPAPARRRGGHPATRAFQAIRIEVNAELAVLEPALRGALDLLPPGGRLAVLSYHSGEDRIVKRVLTEATTGGCTCPPGLPCVCGAVATHRFVVRSRTPRTDEITTNPRAQSARLRAVERIAP